MDRYCVWTLDFRGHGHSDRAPNCNLAGYVSEAETALAAIGRPAIVVGHWLGACVAGVLSQINPNVRAVFLEDPPWLLGRPVGLRDRPNLTRNIGLNASAFVDIDMGNSRVFLHIDIR